MNKISCICNQDSSYIFTLREFKFYKCRSCKLIFVWPTFETKNLYSNDYFRGATHGFGFVNYESDKIASNNYLRSILKKIKKIQTNSLTLLDIGSANGYFVKLSEEFGIKAKGIEISLDAVNWGLKLGRNVINSDFESFNDGIFYDVVTVLDVLEHIQNPKDFIRKVYKSHLKIGGLLVLNVPDSGSYFARLTGKKWHALLPPEHWYFFNRSSLKKLLSDENFKIIKMQNISKSMTLEYILKTIDNSPQSGKLIKLFARVILKFMPILILKKKIIVPFYDNLCVYAEKLT